MHALLSITLVALVAPLASSAHARPCDAPHIQAHLASVERELLAADTAHLSPLQLERRQHHIATLADYRERCEFPRNDAYPDRLVTIFVDDSGTRCAVAHLMAESGADALVAKIRKSRNTATIWELADDPDVQRWLVANGLSLYEAARIQPSYCHTAKGGSCLCGPNYSSVYEDVSGLGEGEIVALDLDNRTVDIRLDGINGTGAVVGDVRTAAFVDGDVLGRRALVVVYNPAGQQEPLFSRGPNRVGGDVECTTHGAMSDPSYCARLDYDVYVAALFSEDCLGRVAAEDPKLGQSPCALNGAVCGAPTNGDEPSGCSGGGAGSLMALGLMALSLARGRCRAVR